MSSAASKSCCCSSNQTRSSRIRTRVFTEARRAGFPGDLVMYVLSTCICFSSSSRMEGNPVWTVVEAVGKAVSRANRLLNLCRAQSNWSLTQRFFLLTFPAIHLELLGQLSTRMCELRGTRFPTSCATTPSPEAHFPHAACSRQCARGCRRWPPRRPMANTVAATPHSAREHPESCATSLPLP